MDTRNFAFPKPKDQKRQPQVAIRVYADGREVCNLKSKAGRTEYRKRVIAALVRQGGVCFVCHLVLLERDATFEHIVPKGMGGGFRDDSNRNCGASHGWCNCEKGSKRIAA